MDAPGRQVDDEDGPAPVASTLRCWRSRRQRWHPNGPSGTCATTSAAAGQVEGPLLSGCDGSWSARHDARGSSIHSAGRLANHHHAPPARRDPMTHRSCFVVRTRPNFWRIPPACPNHRGSQRAASADAIERLTTVQYLTVRW